MNLPAKHTNTGRVLRAMIGAGPLTAGEIRKRAKLHPDTAVTARIRDLRKIGIDVPCMSEPHPTDEHKRVFRYQIARLPRKIREELNRESSRAWMSGEAA